MHKIRNSIICVATILVLPACITTSPTNALDLVIENEWMTFDTAAYRGKRDAVSFVDESTGWYGTGAGDLFQTTDGGQTWQLIKSQPGTFIRSLAFTDTTTGYIGNVGTDYYPGVTDETPLYRTDDGGKNWQAVNLNGQTIKGVCAIDIIKTERIYQGSLVSADIIHAAGRVGGSTGILRSTDSGKTWSVIDMTQHAGMILDIKFFNENEGLVFSATQSKSSDSEGLVLRTNDGGKTWTEVYRGKRKKELIWKASFPNEQTGFATVQSYDADRATQLIIKTEDSGQSWTELNMVDNAKARQFGIGFADAQHGWVGTMAGGFYTSDGGRTFSQAPIARAANKFQILRDENGVPTRVFAIGTELQTLHISSTN